MLLLDASTFVEEIVKDITRIPAHLFNIIPYDMLLTASDNVKNLCGKSPTTPISLFYRTSLCTLAYMHYYCQM